MARIAIVDYGMGNLHSVAKALERVGAAPSLASDASALDAADAVLLPGVGAFGDAMKELNARGLVEPVRARALEAINGGRPFLGICLGMQVLVDEGEEDPGVAGLGIVPGKCPRIIAPGLKIPHMGWNALSFAEPRARLFDGLEPASDVYFVHSFHVVPNDPSWIAATTDYGGDVVAAIARGNLFATQFHPEKSQRIGLAMLTNFVASAASGAATRA